MRRWRSFSFPHFAAIRRVNQSPQHAIGCYPAEHLEGSYIRGSNKTFPVLQDREVISCQNLFSDEAFLKLLLPALNEKKKVVSAA